MKIKFLIVAVFLIINVSLSYSRSLTKNEVIHILIRHSLTPKASQSLIKLVMKFNIEYPQFQVILDHRKTDKESFEKTLSEKTAQRPHLILLSDLEGKTLKSLPNLYKPISEVMTDDLKKIIPILGFPFYNPVEQQFLALPLAKTSPLLFINKKLFKQAGLLAKPPCTWEELEKILPRIKKIGIQAISIISLQEIFFDSFAEVNQQAFLKEDSSYDYEKNNYIQRMNKIQFDRLNHWIEENLYQDLSCKQDAQEAFICGKVAMLFQTADQYFGFEEQKNNQKQTVDYSPALYPYSCAISKKPFAINATGASLWMLRGHSEDEEAVILFLQYLMRAENLMEWHKETAFLPITFETYTLTKNQGFYDHHPVHRLSYEQVIERRRNMYDYQDYSKLSETVKTE